MTSCCLSPKPCCSVIFCTKRHMAGWLSIGHCSLVQSSMILSHKGDFFSIWLVFCFSYYRKDKVLITKFIKTDSSCLWTICPLSAMTGFLVQCASFSFSSLWRRHHCSQMSCLPLNTSWAINDSIAKLMTSSHLLSHLCQENLKLSR